MRLSNAILIGTAALLSIALYVSVDHPLRVYYRWTHPANELTCDLDIYAGDPQSTVGPQRISARALIQQTLREQVEELDPGDEPGFFSKIFNPLGYARWYMKKHLYDTARRGEERILHAAGRHDRIATATANGLAVSCGVYAQAASLGSWILGGTVKVPKPPLRQLPQAEPPSLLILDWFWCLSILHVVVFSVALVRVLWRLFLIKSIPVAPIMPVAATPDPLTTTSPATHITEGPHWSAAMLEGLPLDRWRSLPGIWHFAFQRFDGPSFQMDSKPVCWAGAPFKRLIHHRYWMASQPGTVEELTCTLHSTDANDRFVTVCVPEGRNLLIDGRRLAAFWLPKGVAAGPRTAADKVFDPAYWVVGHALPMVMEGPCLAVLEGRACAIRHDAFGPLLADRVIAVSTSEPSQASTYVTDGGPLSHLVNAMSFSRVLWRFPSAHLVVYENILSQRSHRIHIFKGIFHLIVLLMLAQVIWVVL